MLELDVPPVCTRVCPRLSDKVGANQHQGAGGCSRHEKHNPALQGAAPVGPGPRRCWDLVEEWVAAV